MKKDLLYPICLGVTAVITICCLYICCKAVDALDSINSRVDRANVEYQFVVTDSTITVWDKNRYVGDVKLEGQLDSLITADNE